MHTIITVGSDEQINLNGFSKDYNAVFKAYDIRGVYGEQLDTELAYKLTKAFLHLSPGQKYVLAYDMRGSSKELARAIIQAITEENIELDCLGQTTTDCLYFAVGKYHYAGGIMITASHNSAKFNGIKFVKQKVVPVIISELKAQYEEIKEDLHYLPLMEVEATRELDLTAEFVLHATTFSKGTAIQPLKVVVDAGNGMAGLAAKPFFAHYPQVQLIPMYFEPHPDFPHHEANPALPANLIDLQNRVVSEQADLGVAFDGDGDRVFFVDKSGLVVPGYYIQALLTEYFLKTNKGATVVYDLRYTRAIEAIARAQNGRAVTSKAGHSFIKLKMQQEDAIFGGESTSSHFYFRDNYYADSGLISLQIILKLISETGRDIASLVKPYQDEYFSSGEKNFHIQAGADIDQIKDRLKNQYPGGSFSEFDGFVIDFPDWRFSLRQSNTEPFLRLNVEANNSGLLEEKQAALFNTIQEYARFTGLAANAYALSTLQLTKIDKLNFLFNNLFFTWEVSKGYYLDSLYGQEWSRTQTPIDILRQIDTPVLDQFYERHKSNIEETIRLQETYLEKATWFNNLARYDKLLDRLHTNPIAYFSLEFGLTDWLQIYSGGLGILAGDTLKEASDSGLPLVALGLFYSQGYFYQRFTEDGWQLEDYLPQDVDDYPLEAIKDENGLTILVEVKVGEHLVKVKGWRLRVGRRSLILLDTNITENKDMEDRMITYHLYGGDQDTRIKQEIVLAMAGYKMLKALGINPAILHLNEGHSAFALFAQAEDLMQRKNLSFNDAVKLSKKNILFTNHTLKQAGNDVFPYSLVEKYLSSYAASVGVEFRHIFSLGVDSLYAEGKFGMTILGLNNSAKVNAVSKIHALAAKKIWPDHEMVAVTNGVHLSTWVSESMHRLFDEYLSESWSEQGTPTDWQKALTIPDIKLWAAHLEAKSRLLEQLKYHCGVELKPDTLIFSWFRRFTAYKQPEVLMLDLQRLEALVNDSERPVVFIFGGKAHPQDTEGKLLLQKMWQVTQEPRFKDKVIIIPDYNWRMARYMVSGSDVWINSPVRYQEACGTSGMKAAANGVLQFSTIDGWVDEVVGENMIWEIKDSLDAQNYFDSIEQVIKPLFWQRNEQGLPLEWLARMKQTLKITLANYGSDRMLREYLEKLYKPILKDSMEMWE